MEVSKVGRRGQITLPRDVRRAMGVTEGDRVAFVRRGDEYVVQALTKTLFDMRGSVAVSGPQDWDAVREETKTALAARTVDADG